MSRPAEPRVAVLIVSWNTCDLLESCLEGIEGGLRSGVLEAIVVDNGSQDGTCDMVERRFPEVRLIRNRENTGFAHAVNQAFAVSRAPLVLMLNSDCVASATAIERCADALEARPGAAALGCRIAYPDGRPQSSCFRFPSLSAVVLQALYLAQLFPDSALFNRDRYGRRAFEVPTLVDVVMGSFLMLRRSALPEGPLLDEGYFMYGEEADLCYRLARRGWETLYFPEVEVRHHHGGSTRDARTAAWCYGAKHRAILRFLRKWRAPGVAWLANGVIALSLVPRTIGWLAVDFASALSRGHAPRLERGLRARALGFHLAAVLRPSLLDGSWKREPEASQHRLAASAGSAGTD